MVEAVVAVVVVEEEKSFNLSGRGGRIIRVNLKKTISFVRSEQFSKNLYFIP